MSLNEEIKKARSAAFKYLAYKSRSSSEVADHLKKKDFSNESVLQTVEELKELGYINDTELARQWGRSRIQSRHWGSHRLLQELAQRGIRREIADTVMLELYEEIDEYKIAETCAEKKIRSMIHLDIETQRKRLAPFLQRKGFPVHIVYKILKEFLPAPEND